MPNVKKIWKFLSSMRFALILLVLLAASCALASLVTQGQSYDWYAARYSERVAAWILAFHLDDAFHSVWFVLLSGFLVLNLLFCNLLRFPALLRRSREAVPNPDAPSDARAEGVQDPEAVFGALGLSRIRRATTPDGRELRYAYKNRAGLWGAWVCHLGILLLIVAFSLGQATRQEYSVYGVPGQTRAVGDTGLLVTIDDFRVELRDDNSVEQYTAEITVTNADAVQESASVSVNAPARLFGMTFYQNSTGWAANVRITEDGEPLQETVLCAGEYVPVSDKPELVIYFNAFYPDYELVPGEGPRTRSTELNNPGYLYSVYYRGEILGMNILSDGEELTIDEYTVTFSEPQTFTLIQVKRDAFAWLALVGGLIMTLGLFLAFYVQPVTVWAVPGENGWTVSGASRKGGVLFREQFARALENPTPPRPDNGA